MPAANKIIQQATSERKSVYQYAEEAAQTFINDAGTLHPYPDAVDLLVSNTSIGSERLAAKVISHLVEDVVDPVTLVRTDDGPYVGVIDYSPQDFYYEADEYHDTLGRVTRAVCVPCVEESTFDHQAVEYPDIHQYNKQSQANVARQGIASLPRDASAQERREHIGAHFLDAHSSLTAYEVAGAAPATRRKTILSALGLDEDQREDQASVNSRHSAGDVLKQTGVTFDHVKQSFDLGIDSITVGATLVSGTTIGGNTAIHGGNQSSFNVEDFATASSTSGEVPTSQGDGTLQMQSVSGGIWTEDGNSPFSMSSTDSATYTLASTWDVVNVLFVDDSSSTAQNQMDLRVNGNTGTGYDTRLWSGNSSSDSFIKGVLHTGWGEGCQMLMSGTWGTDFQVGIQGGGEASNGTKAIAGINRDVGSPLDSFTIFDDAAGNASLTARVFGLNQ